MVAVNSDSLSLVIGKPAEKRTIILRPGTPRRFFARLRTASSMVRAPKSASALLIEENAVEATVTGAVEAALESILDDFTPLTAARRRSALAVKFCTILRLPPKSTTAIMVSVPPLASINLEAAPRA